MHQLPDITCVTCTDICEFKSDDNSESYSNEKPLTKLSVLPCKPGPDSNEPLSLLNNNTVCTAEDSEYCTLQKDSPSSEFVTSIPVCNNSFPDLRFYFEISFVEVSCQVTNTFSTIEGAHFSPSFQIIHLSKVQVILKREMNKDRLKRLATYYEALAERIRVDDLLPKLFSYHNYSKEERQRIEKEGQRKGTLAQTQLLLDILKTKDDRAYDLFINSLESTSHTELAQYLQHELSPSGKLTCCNCSSAFIHDCCRTLGYVCGIKFKK